MGMTYEQAKAMRDSLDSAVASASKALERFPRLANGLTPDAVKFSPEFRTAKSRFDYAFAELRAFNQVFVKKFERENRAERNRKLFKIKVDAEAARLIEKFSEQI